jgi:transposase
MTMTMKEICVMTVAVVAVTWVAAGLVQGEQQPMPDGCAQIVAVLDEGGGELSPEEVAKKTNTDIETVRNCTDLWRRTMKDEPAPKDVHATDQTLSPGCAQIVAVLDEGGSLSPEEVAKKTGTDIETVRNCTDLRRRMMEGGPHQ